MSTPRNVIVHIARADGYIARRTAISMAGVPARAERVLRYERLHEVHRHDGGWGGRPTRRAWPLGGQFDTKSRSIVFSRHAPADAPPGVEFVSGAIAPVVSRLRERRERTSG